MVFRFVSSTCVVQFAFLVQAQVQVSSTALRIHNGEFPHHWKDASPEDTFLEIFDAIALQDFHSANAASLLAVVGRLGFSGESWCQAPGVPRDAPAPEADPFKMRQAFGRTRSKTKDQILECFLDAAARRSYTDGPSLSRGRGVSDFLGVRCVR